MARRKPTVAKKSDRKERAEPDRAGGRADRKATPAPAPPKSRIPSHAAVRETIESIVIAFVLAFLFRTFEAEAFVIPTGSMAPTLMGRHKDVTCPECGYPYQVSASDEVYPDSGVLRGLEHQVKACTCPMCRYTMEVAPDNPQNDTYPSFNGDRILVAKFPYRFQEPERWDVAVFKYPAEAQKNYIKRIVGLPGETLRISHGDVFVKRDGEEAFQIARKPAKRLLAMLQPVYDDDYVAPTILRKGWPARWHGEGEAPGWSVSEDLRSFTADGSTADPVWLRYLHIVPSYQDWQQLERGAPPPADRDRPQLISDFCAYNTSSVDYQKGPTADALGLHWVGDLAVECSLDVKSSQGQVVLQLIEGGRRFECVLDVANGQAQLSIDGLEDYAPSVQTAVRGPGTYTVLFANVDDELRFWVDGKLVPFDSPTTYGPLDNTRPQEADLAPVGIASRGTEVTISHLKVFRDIYYIAQKYDSLYGGGIGAITDYSLNAPLAGGYAEFMSDPSHWKSVDMRNVEFTMDADQFFMLGDNSARSKDGRLWGQEHFVRRDLLIGEALFIYWPHSWDKIPYLHVPFPYFPNFARMHVVR